LSDKSLGALIILFCLIFMGGYFVWAFAPYLGPSISGWITPALSEWAFKLPVVLAVYGILVIILWIGYTMATTPPPRSVAVMVTVAHAGVASNATTRVRVIFLIIQLPSFLLYLRRATHSALSWFLSSA